MAQQVIFGSVATIAGRIFCPLIMVAMGWFIQFTPVRCLKVSSGGAYGNCVQVKHADGYISLYAHLRIVYVKPGMLVDEQTALGLEGATGNVTGKHLHLEVHKGAYMYPASIDPLAFIRERMGGEELEKKIKIRLNGLEKTVQAIEKAGHNYVMLQDLRDGRIDISYDSKAGVPVVEVK